MIAQGALKGLKPGGLQKRDVAIPGVSIPGGKRSAVGRLVEGALMDERYKVAGFHDRFAFFAYPWRRKK